MPNLLTTPTALDCDRAWVEIDLDALTHNIRALQALLQPGTEVMAVVKANAYGHGAVTVARVAAALGVQTFGVATVPEGIELRQAGISQPIIILSATHTQQQMQAIAHWHLEPTLCSVTQAEQLAQVLASPLPVHLKIDTGMSRLGPYWTEAIPFMQQVQQLPHLQIQSLYSHFATADDPDPTYMKEQQARFDQVIESLPALGLAVPKLHLANSAGALSGKAFHYDMVRLGLALYGIYPGPQFQNALTLKPVMQVRAYITQIKTVSQNQGISYGHTYISPQDCRVAVVSIGYADGVPRRLSNQMQVSVRGQTAPQLGVVTMDQFMIDISHIPTATVGDIVTLIGRDGPQALTVEDWANPLGTIPYEITCGFKDRLPRVELPEPTGDR